MKIQLNQNEIFAAITGYVGQRFKLNGSEKIEIDLTASRGPQGYTATVDIDYPESFASNVTAAAPHDDAQQTGPNPLPAADGTVSTQAAVETGAKSADDIFGT